MADKLGPAGGRLLKGTKRNQGEQIPRHPGFEAGNDSDLDSSRPSSTSRNIAGPREAFDQQTFDLGDYRPVGCSSFFGSIISTDGVTSGETPLAGSQEGYSPQTTDSKRRCRNRR